MAEDGQRVEGPTVIGAAVASDEAPVLVGYEDNSGNAQIITFTANNGLPVDIVAGDVELDLDPVTDGQAGAGGDKGLIVAGYDGTNYRFIKTTATGEVDIRDLTQASDSVAIGDGTNLISLNGSGQAEIVISDVVISSQTDDLKVTLDGEIVEVSRPKSDYTYGTSAVAKGANADIVTYSPTADERQFGVEVSALGYAKWTISYGTTASEVTKIVFWTTPSNPSRFVDLSDVELASTETIIINGENNNLKAGNMDMFVSLKQEE